MPATKTKKRNTVKGPAKKKPARPKLNSSITLVMAAFSGLLLGLSAPGINQSYLAWFALVPLLLLTVSSTGIRQAFGRALVFGTAYNLVYLNWYLQLHPLTWMNFNWLESIAVAGAAWIFLSLQQGLYIALTASIIKVLPLSGSVLPRQVEDRWCLPALLVIPTLWVIMQNKVCNAHDLLGVPWPMLEYSQYQQLPLIQSASLIGGLGIGFLIVLVNVSIACLIATISQHLSFKSLAAASTTSALSQCLAVALCVTGMMAWGYSRLGTTDSSPSTMASVIQGNINIEMQKTTQPMNLSQLTAHYQRLVESTPPGICVWTESALPTYLKEEKDTVAILCQLSHAGKRDMIIGSLDKDFDGRPYNSAFGVTSKGTLVPNIYHKRYLVPFGEYKPSFVNYLPEWIQKLTSTPAGVGFNSGKIPVVLNLSDHNIAPLICFETLSPELAVTSVRNGGDLLVNLTDLAWFHNSMVGDQMIAFSVLRAVETNRYFVFAANTGPSAIIDNNGRIISRSRVGQELILKGKVRFDSHRTPFTQWFN